MVLSSWCLSSEPLIQRDPIPLGRGHRQHTSQRLPLFVRAGKIHGQPSIPAPFLGTNIWFQNRKKCSEQNLWHSGFRSWAGYERQWDVLQEYDPIWCWFLFTSSKMKLGSKTLRRIMPFLWNPCPKIPLKSMGLEGCNSFRITLLGGHTVIWAACHFAIMANN